MFFSFYSFILQITTKNTHAAIECRYLYSPNHEDKSIPNESKASSHAALVMPSGVWKHFTPNSDTPRMFQCSLSKKHICSNSKPVFL
mmetsp:Transcript_16564/g.47549  ORF Transcript_16564/g.47549 Transcript_16564/m.47549 type:complete len:87 (+) Transcript_16564:25-285(+)